MTDYLEEALEGLDALVRRLRRIGATSANKEEDVAYFPDMRQNTGDLRKKKWNISDIRMPVDNTEFGINRNKNQVYNLDMAGRTSPWGAAIEEDGGRTASWGTDVGDSAGRGAILRPAELEKAPDGRAGGRDGAPVPQREPGAEWISGEGAEVWAPAGETGTSGLPASEEMQWAEQADRVFRRDSRRYDGGFYLY